MSIEGVASGLTLLCSGAFSLLLCSSALGSGEVTPAHRSPRSRPVRIAPADYENPAGWLGRYSTPLASLSIDGDARDLEPLRHWIGSSKLIGLGDTSHGTREFYLWKTRVVSFLVREMNFTTLALEAPAPYANKLDDFVNGGSGDPARIVLDEKYWFWGTEEVVELLVWLRAYNDSRGDRPAVRITGIDPWLADPLRVAVGHYLEAVDSAAAAAAQRTYQCFAKGVRTGSDEQAKCLSAISAVADAMVRNRARYIAASSERRFVQAEQNARMLRQTAEIAFSRTTQGTRDKVMAENVSALRSGEERVALWGHSVHVGKLPYDLRDGYGTMDSLGTHLKLRHPDYFVIGSTTARGWFSSVTLAGGVQSYADAPIPPLAANSYEQLFSTGPHSMSIIPLTHLPVPKWLAEPRPLLFMFASPVTITPTMIITEQYDAIVHIDETTPTRRLQ